MIWLRKTSILFTLFFIISALLILSSWTPKMVILVEKGYVKGRTRALVRIYEESVNNTKGTLLYSDWIQQDEYISVNTEKGRIIYDYRYFVNDNWITDVHVSCLGGRDEAVSIP